MVEVMKIMATSFKRSCPHTAVLSASDPEAGHGRPTPPQETPGHSQGSLGQSLAPFSWVPVHIKFCLCPQRICFPSPM